MRTLLAQAIANDAQLQAMGLVAAGVLTGDVDTPQARPFVNLKWGSSAVGLRKTTAANNLVTIWVHDLPNDYSRIIAMMARIKVLLHSIQAQHWQETSPWNTGDPSAVSLQGWLYDIRWQTDSTDFVDEGHGTITRNAVYAIMSN